MIVKMWFVLTSFGDVNDCLERVLIPLTTHQKNNKHCRKILDRGVGDGNRNTFHHNHHMCACLFYYPGGFTGNINLWWNPCMNKTLCYCNLFHFCRRKGGENFLGWKFWIFILQASFHVNSFRKGARAWSDYLIKIHDSPCVIEKSKFLIKTSSPNSI